MLPMIVLKRKRGMRYSAVAAAVLAFAFAPPSFASGERLTAAQQEMATAHGAYVKCVQRHALRLEPSGDSADDIATAAVTECRKHEIDMMTVGIMTGKPFSVSEFDRIDGDMHAAAVTAVVEFRAQRNRAKNN